MIVQDEGSGLVGQGPSSRLICRTANSHVIRVDDVDTAVLANLYFSTSVSRTGGWVVRAVSSTNLRIHDLWIDGGVDGIGILGCLNTHISHCRLVNLTGPGINVRGTDGGEAWEKSVDTYVTDVLIDGASVGNTTRRCLQLDSGADGVYFMKPDFVYGVHGVVIKNSHNSSVRTQHLFFTQVLTDQTQSDGGSIGDSLLTTLTGRWGASSLQGHGYYINAATDVRITNSMGVRNAKHGLYIDGGGGEYMISGDVFNGNSYVYSGYDGIKIAANIGDFTLGGVRSGGNCWGGSVSQNYGINVATGASNRYIIQGCRPTGNISNRLNDGGGGTDKSVTGNIQ